MAKIEMNTARTTQQDPAAAADELIGCLGSATPKLVTLFASADRDHRALNKAVRDRLPKETRLIGSTAAGEIDRDGMHEGSAVLGALSGNFEVGLGLGRGLSLDAITAGNDALMQASQQLGVKPADLNPRRHIGLVMDDAGKMKKEELLLGILEKNQSLLLAGGGASDYEMDPQKQRPLLHVDGDIVDDAVLLALFSTEAPFAALRTHWYEPTGQTLRITKVDETHTRALEIDDKPAAIRYGELIDVPPSALGFPSPVGFIARPTALRVGREYFIRAPALTLPDDSIVFANLLEEGTELEIMRLGDPVGSLRRFFEQEVPRAVRNPSAAFFFNCSVRKFFTMGAGLLPPISETFRLAPPGVGLNVNFELYCGFHINTTLTMLAFGEDR